MRKKRLLSLVLTIGVVLGGTNFAYASEGVKESRIGAIVEENEMENYDSSISNEEAVSIATTAMKEYLNKDTNCFSSNEVIRYDYSKNTEVEVEGQKYMVCKLYAGFINNALKRNDIEYAKSLVETALEDETPSTIAVRFYKSDSDDRYEDNQVTIDAKTGEVIRVARQGRRDIFKGEVRKDKIKESIINVLAKAGLKPDENTNWDSIFVCHDGGDAHMYLNVNGGKAVEVAIDLDDFSVVRLYKLYRVYPNEDFGIE